MQRGSAARAAVVWIACFGVGFGAAAAVRVARAPSDSSRESSTPSGARGDAPSRPRTGGDAEALEARFQEGLGALRSGAWPRAIEAFRDVAGRDPSDPRPQFGLGRAYERIGMGEESAAAFRRALEIDPTFFHASEELAKLLHESGQYREALELLEGLESRGSSRSFVIGERAINHLALGETDEAIRLLAEYTRIEGPTAWGLAQLGRALADAGRDTEAEAALRRALAIDPRFTMAHYRLGRLLARTGRAEEAERELEIHRRLRDLETRAVQYRMSLARDPDDVDSLAFLARTWLLLGKAGDAEPLVERVARLAPEDPRVADLRAMLQRARGAGEAAPPR